MSREILLFRVLPAAILVAVATIVLYFIFWRYDPRSFRGDGTLVETGPVYPRYRIEFEPVTLSATFRQEFRFGGCPRESFTLLLELACSDAEVLDQAGTRLSCALKDSQGVEVSAAAGALEDWLLRESVSGCGFWHPALRGVSLAPAETYLLTIEVTTNEGAETATVVRAVPVLRGGGYETP